MATTGISQQHGATTDKRHRQFTVQLSALRCRIRDNVCHVILGNWHAVCKPYMPEKVIDPNNSSWLKLAEQQRGLMSRINKAKNGPKEKKESLMRELRAEFPEVVKKITGPSLKMPESAPAHQPPEVSKSNDSNGDSSLVDDNSEKEDEDDEESKQESSEDFPEVSELPKEAPSTAHIETRKHLTVQDLDEDHQEELNFRIRMVRMNRDMNRKQADVKEMQADIEIAELEHAKLVPQNKRVMIKQETVEL